MAPAPRPTPSLPGLSAQRDGTRAVHRTLPEEVPVALVFEGTTQAVMLASPADLEDFAVGFAIGEGIVSSAADIETIETVSHASGIEARMWLAGDRSEALRARRRAMAGPVGCGLCGIDSLEAALRPLRPLPQGGAILSRADVAGASAALHEGQAQHRQTGAMHAAGFLVPGGGVEVVREDVGRHNALDKLIGAMARSGRSMAGGAVVMSSRVSVELVQKCVTAGCPLLIAVSAPTALAVQVAQEAGLTLVAFARGGGFDVYAHPGRIAEGQSDVA
jgi:FdhD protein